jgi:hypothetical protein
LDRKAILDVLSSNPKFQKLVIVRIESAEGGGATIDLAERPHYSGPSVLLKKVDGAWRVAAEHVWIGEGELPSAEELEKVKRGE